jgi:hypothetical protein
LESSATSLSHLIRERTVLKYQNIVIASIALFTWSGAGFAQNISPPLAAHGVPLFPPKMMAARAVVSDAVPVEAGLASVSVTVSDSIQLQ